jgi:hypothetical protein
LKVLILLSCIIIAAPTVTYAGNSEHHRYYNREHPRKEHIIHVRFMSLNSFLETKRFKHKHNKVGGLSKIHEIISRVYTSHNLSLIQGLKALPPVLREQTACLALTVYHEDRGSTLADQKATAFVVVNRTKADSGNIFGRTICDVVSQRRVGAKAMQFSWMSESSRALVPKEENAWKISQEVAYDVLNGKEKDLTNGAQFFWSPKHSTRQRWMTKGISYHTFGHHIYMKLSSKFMK